jgi:hypothetical protein
VDTASDCSTSTDNNNAPVMALDGVQTTRFWTGQKMVDKVATGNFRHGLVVDTRAQRLRLARHRKSLRHDRRDADRGHLYDAAWLSCPNS